jgi:hypothetical protein
MSEVSRKEFDELKQRVESLNHGSNPNLGSNVESQVLPEPKKRAPKEPSKYNIYMGQECKKIKEKHPTLSNTEIFKLAAERWQDQKAPAPVSAPVSVSVPVILQKKSP